MILVDMNQVMISNLMIHLNSNELNEDMVRHMVLNSLRSYKTKFGDNYGELVLCYDDKHYWDCIVILYSNLQRKLQNCCDRLF